ncbi:MAG: AGE family epimerase/isomerase [Verrucomicrobia bacterium]|nr:AGE family epimerase/isomerase [Verrucomicrobiota bacterium]
MNPPSPFPSTRPPAPADWSALVSACRPKIRTALAESIVPFWWRAIDGQHGGVFTCWNNAGTRLLSRDKFTWSQGRFAWLWSRLADATTGGLLPGNADRFLAQAEKTVQFLEAHARLDDGRCAFLLSEDGQVKEAVPGQGPAPSIYADCFVVMGFAEFARVRRDAAALDFVWRLFGHIEQRLAAGGFPTHPAPVPPGHRSHAVTMIHLNMTLVLRAACEFLGDARAERARERALAAAKEIFDVFLLPGGRIAELVPVDGARDDTLLARHVNPGHALEGLWMLLSVAAREGRADWLARATEAVRYALAVGWDAPHGGLLYFVDREGGAPAGRAGDSVYENGVRNSWDKKLWWVHSEALFASLLCHRLTGDAAARTWFERVFEYTFRVFPQQDPTVGEWIQIRDRHGVPVESVVALPVKDPYHIARNLIQCLELLSAPHPPLLP